MLEVKDNGTYALHFKSSGRTFENTGVWEFETWNGKVLLTFRQFRFGLPGYGNDPPGMWPVEPTRSRGSIRLVIDDDLGYHYHND